jgi:hypothetical protein
LGIVRFALKYPHTFYVVAALILFLGVTAAIEMPTDIFPEIDIPVVSVDARLRGTVPIGYVDLGEEGSGSRLQRIGDIAWSSSRSPAPRRRW